MPNTHNHHPTTDALADHLRFAIHALAPTLTLRTSLLDLRAHGGKDSATETAQTAKLAAFLLPLLQSSSDPTFSAINPSAPSPPENEPRQLLRQLRQRCAQLHRQQVAAQPQVDIPVGVDLGLIPLAAALDVEPKTLANSLRARRADAGLNTARRDHRWLLWLARTLQAAPAPDLWHFHDRTAAATVNTMARWRGDYLLDAADALLLHSLVALWQRRRPTAESRAHGGRATSRRALAKPIAALDDWLISSAMVTKLADILVALHGEAAATPWLGMVAECGLSQAHILMHRASKDGAVRSADRLLRVTVEVADRIEAHDPKLTAMLRYRTAWMQAWRAQCPGQTAHPPAPDGCIATHAYVRWSQWLAASRQTRHGSHVKTSTAADSRPDCPPPNRPPPNRPPPLMLSAQVSRRKTP